MSSELFHLIGHALRPLDTMAQRDKPKPKPVPAPTHWSEFTLEDAGWCLHLGYTASGDPADDGDIRIVRIILNTGQRDISLAPADLDRDTFFACEEQCREEWRASYEVQP
jgi:hypothetical protein